MYSTSCPSGGDHWSSPPLTSAWDEEDVRQSTIHGGKDFSLDLWLFKAPNSHRLNGAIASLSPWRPRRPPRCTRFLRTDTFSPANVGETRHSVTAWKVGRRRPTSQSVIEYSSAVPMLERLSDRWRQRAASPGSCARKTTLARANRRVQ